MASTSRRSEAIWIEAKGYWQIKVQKDGTRKGFTSSITGRKGKHEAEAKADEWLERGTENVRFEAAWIMFLEYQKAHHGTSNYTSHEWAGRLYICPVVGNRALGKITPIIWQKCIDIAAQKGLAQRSCLTIRLSISAFISFARRNRWGIDRLERGDITIPDSAPKAQKKILQPDQLDTLFTADHVLKFKRPAPVHFIHAWRFVVLTGIRRGELAGLRNDDILDGIMHINRSINKHLEETPGKNDNARRYIALSAHAAKVLDDQRGMLKRLGIISPWVFPDEYGERMNPDHMYDSWAFYRKKHGITVSIHEMRHTLVSLLKADMPVELLKTMIGHAEDMDTFGVYGHVVAGDMQLAAQIVDDVFLRLLKW